MFDLEAILKYNMSELEAKAYKIALLWQDFSQKEFPNYKHTKLRKNGDPRKSLLFKYCYKLIKETQGLIKDEEYRLYVLAQLQILKTVSYETARIDPHSLCGDKAWRRWKKWKRIYEQKKLEFDNSTIEKSDELKASKSVIEKDLRKTKQFLTQRFGQTPSCQNIYQAMHDHTMIRWVIMDRISPYYLLLSPCVKSTIGDKTLNEFFLFDLDVYKKSIDDKVEKLFKEIFDYEF